MRYCPACKTEFNGDGPPYSVHCVNGRDTDPRVHYALLTSDKRGKTVPIRWYYPPEGTGWTYFGTHANSDPCDYSGALEMVITGEDGLPMYERHSDGSPCSGPPCP